VSAWSGKIVAVSDSLADDVTYQRLDAVAFVAELNVIWRIYVEAKQEPPNLEVMRRHTRCRGFRCLTACHDGAIIGFAYGMYDGQGTGQGLQGVPPSRGSQDLLEQFAPHLVPSWGKAFDIAEVHVQPAWQGKNIGTNLLCRLCDSLRGDVMLTVEDGARARNLYGRLGFSDLVHIPLDPRPVNVMGTSLPLPGP
jgi:GNAT superfamily N-acetyltransferase